MNMHNPAHPGELLTDWLDDLSVSVTAFAAHIGISRVMLSRVVNGHAAVSADMDLRLSEALGTNQGYWLALQTQRDLWTARQSAKGRSPLDRRWCKRGIAKSIQLGPCAASALARSNTAGAKLTPSSDAGVPNTSMCRCDTFTTKWLSLPCAVGTHTGAVEALRIKRVF